MAFNTRSVILISHNILLGTINLKGIYLQSLHFAMLVTTSKCNNPISVMYKKKLLMYLFI